MLGVHVDDLALGGVGPLFESSIAALRQRFPFRKWRVRSGEFCGAMYRQEDDGPIHMNMKTSAEKIRHANISKNLSPKSLLEPGQVKALHAINGSVNSLASQSPPDLSVQTSLSQQCFPNPKVKHLRQANGP